MIRALVYGDVSLNVTDGSSVWLTQVCQTLAGVVDEVHVLAKMPVVTDRLLGTLDAVPNVVVHASEAGRSVRDPGGPALEPARAAARLHELALELAPGLVLVRGFDACVAAAGTGSLAGRLWAYITDLPFPLHRVSPQGVIRLRRVARSARRVLAQTESARAYVESIAPEASGKTVLLPPTVPASFFDVERPDHAVSESGAPLRLIYAGKFARDWRTLEMLELPRLLRARGIDTELVMVGDKFQRDPQDPGWHVRMREALARTAADPSTGVVWTGGVTRAEAAARMAAADIGLGWRSAALNSSLELSSKLLEYGASGAAPLLNRTGDHERLYAPDYPLFLDRDDPDHVVEVLAASAAALPRARARATKVSLSHTSDTARAALTHHLDRAGVLRAAAPTAGPRPVRVLIVTHDPKFLGDLLDHLRHNPDIELRLDQWRSLRSHDERASADLLAWADVILCEWAGPNLVWCSHRVAPHQTLITRLHAFELRGPWLDGIDVGRVDRWVFVSDEYRSRAQTRLGFPVSRGMVIPNALDVPDLDRPKAPDARLHLGLMGIVTFNKRPDRALDLLDRLVQEDDRYLLHIKGRMPWEYDYEWSKPVQRLAYEDLFDRIRNSPRLRDHLVFETFSPDVGTWLRGIGIMLSPSLHESFHLAPAEGMASGAVPVVWDRGGAREVFGSDHVVPDTDAAVARVLDLQDPLAFARAADAARRWASRWDLPGVHARWDRLLLGSRARDRVGSP